MILAGPTPADWHRALHVDLSGIRPTAERSRGDVVGKAVDQLWTVPVCRIIMPPTSAGAVEFLWGFNRG